MKNKWILLLMAGVMVVLTARKSPADVVAVQQYINGASVLDVLKPGPIDFTTIDDPQMIVRRLIRGSVPFSGLSFSFDALSGSGDFDYYNGNSFALASLTFTILPGDPAGITDSMFACGIQTQLTLLPFSNCRFSQFGGATTPTILSFYGGSGLPTHSHFDVEMNGFQPNSSVSAEATPLLTPEPGMAVLILSGIGSLLTQARPRKILN